MSVETYGKYMAEKNLNDTLLSRYLDLQENNITTTLEGVSDRISKKVDLRFRKAF